MSFAYFDWIAHHAEVRGDKTALIDLATQRRLTYRALDERTDRLAAHLARLGVKRGERVAIMGPSGSGKSTMLNLICGLDIPTPGRVWVGGTELSQLTDDERTRLRREKIGMIFQSFNLLPTLSAVENVSLPLRLRDRSRRDAEKRAQALLERVGLHRQATHRPDQMSGGECQRVAIARALIFDPPLLLAD